MIWKPSSPFRADYAGSRLRYALRKLGNLATLLPIPWHGKTPRAYAHGAIEEAEAVIRAARLVMAPRPQP